MLRRKLLQLLPEMAPRQSICRPCVRAIAEAQSAGMAAQAMQQAREVLRGAAELALQAASTGDALDVDMAALGAALATAEVVSVQLRALELARGHLDAAREA
jgi:hypothetical protein